MALALQDTFTAVDGTRLSAHTPEVGGWAHWPYSSVEANAVINSNRLDNDGAASDAASSCWRAVDAPVSADYATKISAYYQSTSRRDFFPCVRMQTGSRTCYTVLSSPVGSYTLYRCVSGAFTSLGSYTGAAWAIGSTHDVQISAEGVGSTVAVIVKIDGVARITASDTSASRIVSAGYGGFWISGGSGTELDEIKIGPIAEVEATDVTAPVLTLPVVVAISATMADVSVTTNEARGTLYCLASANATESAAAIRAGASVAVTASGVQRVRLASLTPSSSMYAHFLQVDAANNESAPVRTDLLTTADPSALTIAYILGDSTSAEYSGQNKVSSYLDVNYLIYDMAVPGDSIDSQKTDWLALSVDDRARAAVVIVQLGLNDIEYTEATSVDIARLQSLIDEIYSDVNQDCDIIISQMTPCRARLITLYGETNGEAAYQKWLAMNTAIAGGGPTPITGVDGRVTAHVAQLNDGNGNLAVAYDLGDRIHENNAGREIVAAAWQGVIDSLTDATAPVLTGASGAPTGQTTATLHVTTDTAEGVADVVVTTSATKPSAAQIQAGTDHTGTAAPYHGQQAVAASGVLTFSATGLTASTTYYAHFTHEDLAGNDALVASSAAFTTDALPHVNTPPTGSVTISGTPTQGQTLSVVDTLADVDGLGQRTYTWRANGTIVGTGTTYVLQAGDVGNTVTVTASYTDGYGAAESVTSAAVGPVAALPAATIIQPSEIARTVRAKPRIQSVVATRPMEA